ncbi:MAG: TolC family protein [Pyrinomonadaceae bacterium]|nr:TolC family protein [Pyrinomonadaceae bacterium]
MSFHKFNILLAVAFLLASFVSAPAQQQGQPPTPQQPVPSQQPAPQQPAPSANNPPAQSGGPPSNAQGLTTDAQTQQSAQPAPQGGQQPPAGNPNASQPNAPAQAPAGRPVSVDAPITSQPGATIPPPGVVRAPGRESVPGTAPSELPLDVPPVAPDFRAAPGPLPELNRVGVDMAEQRPLSLREAITLALKNGKDIEVARDNVRAAEFDLLGARGVFDPRFSSFSYYERSETPSSSFLSGGPSGATTQSSYTGTFRFEGLVPKGGGGYRADFSSIRLTTDNQFASLNPQYPTALTFSYTQPLLRGRSFDQSRRVIEIAKKNLSLTDAQFRQRAIETITNVQRSYWDLVFALRNLQVQRDTVRDARAQLEHNRRLVAEGFLAPVDVVAAEAQVSGFEQSVYTALDDVGRAENALKNLIAENRESDVWGVALVPTDAVDAQPAAAVALPQAMETALKNRPELQQSDVASAINEIEQRFAREQSKPQVDLVGSYGVVGLAGSLNDNGGTNPFTAANEQLRARINQLSQLNGLPPLPPPAAQVFPGVLVGGLPQSLVNLGANRFNNYRVGVQLNLPLRNRTAQAQLGRALVERDRIRTQREQLEQLIQVDVRNALQVTRTAESRLRSAVAARSASEQQYASEQRRFDAGQSTFFLVLERQTALATARGNELRAQTELNKAVAELQRATGNALEVNQVQVSVR